MSRRYRHSRSDMKNVLLYLSNTYHDRIECEANGFQILFVPASVTQIHQGIAGGESMTPEDVGFSHVGGRFGPHYIGTATI